MNQTASQIDPTPEGRRQARTHLFVAATLCADAGSSPVHIRNMSQSGALVEAAVLPDVGEKVRLKRGRLYATGSIVWRTGRKAGLRLDAAVHVADWMSRQVSAGQERVDALVSIVRNNASTAATMAAEGPDRISIEAELGQLRVELAALENALTEDVIVIATHPEIQTLDISVQRIDRILKSLRSEG